MERDRKKLSKYRFEQAAQCISSAKLLSKADVDDQIKNAEIFCSSVKNYLD